MDNLEEELVNFGKIEQSEQPKTEVSPIKAKRKFDFAPTLHLLFYIGLASLIAFAGVKDTQDRRQKRYLEYHGEFKQVEQSVSAGNIQEADRISEELQKKLAKEWSGRFGSLGELVTRYDDETIDPEIAKLNKKSEYMERFDQIKKSPARFPPGEIQSNIRRLYSDIKKDDFPGEEKLLKDIKSFNYTAVENVSKRVERRLISEGHYDKQWVEPEYEEREVADIENGIMYGIPRTIMGTLFLPFTNKEHWDDTKDTFTKKTKVKVKEGYYKDVWVEPEYKDIIVPASRRKIEINPYSGEIKEIEKLP
ncbi:MAG: hypothetical protein ABIH72_02525 [archaeon]